MAGVIVQVLPKRVLDFNALAAGTPPNNTEDLVLMEGIDVSNWREVGLMLRVHKNSIVSSATGNIIIGAQLEGRTSEDPGILFADSTLRGAVTIDNTVTAPFFRVQSLGSGVGAMIRIIARGTRNADPGALDAIVSVSLSLKHA